MVVPNASCGGLSEIRRLALVKGDYLEFFPPALRPEPLPRTESSWWRWRDMKIHVQRVGEPTAARRAILLHGAGGHADAMWPFAALLAVRGFQVAVPDLPGYGRTRVPKRHRIRYPDWQDVAADFLRSEATSSAPLLMGASVGGMLAYDVATRTGSAETVLATCLLDPRSAAARERIARTPALGRLAGPLLKLARPADSLPVPVRWFANMRGMSSCRELVDVVIADEMGGGNSMPLGFLRSYLRSAPAVEPERAHAVKVVLAHPAADTWTPVELSRSFFDRLAGPKELVMLPEAGHYPIEAPGVERLVDVAVSC
ncbi:Lysophospholipase, alpha-beta hydrolase superfamily [Saccharopolyspora kobensis]|uniref:Lysophospholipase, alpha-beta hydrolase superfamily n=1 Tax=Saccharopolyspora kobensis TaxID=146035 RepID=A0A1H6EDV7_9PSEU|nr:Lysophospholipase, alpha-beta hydrolase superfamily [Saccharopolyspora kobensis]SFD59836.1 Lysophospholipase, alpha-beta hydrolase superfamily [Saccharopolyspora kobensis]